MTNGTEHHWLITAQVQVSPGQLGVVNMVTNTHPALVMLEAQKNRQPFTLFFFAEIPADIARTVNTALEVMNRDRSPILVPNR